MNKCNVPKKKTNYNFNFCKNLINNQKQPSRDVLQFRNSTTACMFSCEFSKKIQNSFFTEHLETATSE